MQFIPKHYLLSDPSFWETKLIKWEYTDTVLLTAYDLLRNDRIIYQLQSNSMTLKELLYENGFPKKTKIFADSGIFLFEWLKLLKEKSFKLDYLKVNLPTKEILEAYKLIDPDFLVAPDEIILANDKKDDVKRKIDKIKNNAIKTLENFSTNKVVGVIQGVDEATITRIYELEKDLGIRNFARGGLIPLRRRKNMYCKALKLSRNLTNGSKLHVFGITSLSQINCYGKCAKIDTFDSTIAKAITGRLIWINKNLRKEKFDDQIINKCNCKFCKNIRKMDITNNRYISRELLENLYLHNIITISKYSKQINPFLLNSSS
ncbi:MAG: hypothetical protein ACTSVB_10085 [Candidatus Heimdallarchaeaceae archaeon]